MENQKNKYKSIIYILSFVLVLVIVFTSLFTAFAMEFNDDLLTEGYEFASQYDSDFNLYVQPNDDTYNYVSFYNMFGTDTVEVAGSTITIPYYGIENYRVSKNTKLCFVRYVYNNGRSVTYYPYRLNSSGEIEQVRLWVYSTYNFFTEEFRFPQTSAYPQYTKNSTLNNTCTFLKCDYPIFSNVQEAENYLKNDILVDSIYTPGSFKLPNIDSFNISQTNTTDYNLYFNVYDYLSSNKDIYVRCTYSLNVKNDTTNNVVKPILNNNPLFDGYLINKAENRKSVSFNQISQYNLYNASDYVEIVLNIELYTLDNSLYPSSNSSRTISFKVTNKGVFISDTDTRVPSDSEVVGNGTIINGSGSNIGSGISNGSDYISNSIVGLVNGDIFYAIGNTLSFIPNALWTILIAGVLVGIVLGILKRFL